MTPKENGGFFLHIKAVDLQADFWSILKTFLAGFETDYVATFEDSFGGPVSEPVSEPVFDIL